MTDIVGEIEGRVNWRPAVPRLIAPPPANRKEQLAFRRGAPVAGAPVADMADSVAAIGVSLPPPPRATDGSHERQPDQSDIRPTEAVKHDPQYPRQYSRIGTIQADR